MYALLIAALAAAQPIGAGAPTAPPVVVPLPAQTCCRLAKLTGVALTIAEPIDSDKAQIGQSFTIRLAEPLDIGGGHVIPAGVRGAGEVIHAAKSRAMGKPGELLLAARYLDWNGTRIPLRSFRFGDSRGKDNVGTAVVVGVAVSALITPFITGGEVRIPAGASASAKVAQDVEFSPPANATPAQNDNSNSQGGE